MKMRYIERMGKQKRGLAIGAEIKAFLRKMDRQNIYSDNAVPACLEHFCGYIKIGKKFVFVIADHPRVLYAEKIEHEAKAKTGPYPEDSSLMNSWRESYLQTLDEMLRVGIDFIAKPRVSRYRFNQYTYLNLVAPIAYDPETFDESLKQLVKRLLSGEIILSEHFAGYEYTQENYLEDLVNGVMTP